MRKGFTEAERQIVTALIETKALDFKALGDVFAKHGPSATFALDGEDVFCGTMRRFIRVFRLADNMLNVEQLADLSKISTDIQGQ